MQTTGNGNETLMILVPVASLVAVILLGGSAEALEAVNAIAGEIAYLAMAALKALL